MSHKVLGSLKLPVRIRLHNNPDRCKHNRYLVAEIRLASRDAEQEFDLVLDPKGTVRLCELCGSVYYPADGWVAPVR